MCRGRNRRQVDACARVFLFAHFDTERRYCRIIEQTTDRDVDPEIPAHPCQHSHGGQRVPAKIEEIVLDTKIVSFQHLLPNCTQPFLNFAARANDLVAPAR